MRLPRLKRLGAPKMAVGTARTTVIETFAARLRTRYSRMGRMREVRRRIDQVMMMPFLWLRRL